MEFKIEATLDEFEADVLADVLTTRICKHRQDAVYEHGLGKITQAELDWHLKHADYVESVARKLFPDFMAPPLSTKG